MSTAVASQAEIDKMIKSDPEKQQKLSELSPDGRKQTQPKNLPPSKRPAVPVFVGMFGYGAYPVAVRAQRELKF